MAAVSAADAGEAEAQVAAAEESDSEETFL
jgi:hypothetical protein